jgi:diaminopimelate epimerase
VLLARAREHLDTVLPGYTHLQRAQPVRLAHHWLAFVEMFGATRSASATSRRRLALSPLGSGALAGTTLPLDRDATARALGFAGPSRNSMDAVASRDAGLEFLAAGAIAQVHLSRLAEELVLWSTAEFAFIELADAYSTGSSLMPQKKNPDVPELVRGKAGRAIGNLVALLTVLKGLPLTYNRDLQEDKEPIFDTARTLRDSLEVMAGAIATLRVNEARMREAASDPMLLATDLAEALVREGVAFREAHEAVGRIVAHCIEKDADLRSLSREDLRAFHPAFPPRRSELLSLERALEGRSLPGATARRACRGARRGEAELAAARRELESARMTRRIARAIVVRALVRRDSRRAALRSARAPRSARAAAATPARSSRPEPAGHKEHRCSELPLHEDARRRQRLRRARRRARRAAADRAARGAPVRSPPRDRRRSAARGAARRERRLPHGDLERRRLAGGDVRERDPRVLQVPARSRPTDARRDRVETLSGVVRPRWAGADRVTVDMGRPILAPAKIPTTLGVGRRTRARRAARGRGRDAARLVGVDGQPARGDLRRRSRRDPVERWGPRHRAPPAFPNRVNVEFVRVTDRGRIAQRTWERGAGETLACGSGACAVAVVSMLRASVDRAVRIELRGGVLEICWPADDAHVEMTGPAAECLHGRRFRES